jgi:hypothetical protein
MAFRDGQVSLDEAEHFSSTIEVPERSGGRMPLAEKGVRRKGRRQPLSPP